MKRCKRECNEGNMTKLNCLYQDNLKMKAPTVSYDYEVTKKSLILVFKVKGTEKVFGESYRPKDKPAFALWEMDVVEFFGRYKDQQSYFEFQVSPYGQFFELEILEPRKKINLEYKSGITKKVKLAANKKDWEAKIEIPLLSLTHDKTDVKNEVPILGNFFAILGQPMNRFYFSSFLPVNIHSETGEKVKPDFHQPKYFEII